jgi:hypothetical protein
LGSTDSQGLAGEIYPAVRSALIAGSSSAAERTLYEALPVEQRPTDLGNATLIGGPSAVLRALDLIPRVANPEQEPEAFGNAPSIGFNSSFDFDFNPDDGIDVDKTDFIGVALHEIGHALGFSSNNGFEAILEAQPDATPVLTIWDLFRFRPSAGFEFTTAPRVLTSGGEQVFFADGPELPLSTGGFAGDRGDGRQSSHWKDDDLSGFYLGIMDPTLPRGTLACITDSDLIALDAMGYTIQNDPTPVGLCADDHTVSIRSVR